MREVTSIPPLPPRADMSHKGDFGRTLIVGGSVGLSGAVLLAGGAALRSGAGLVDLAVPRTVWPVAAGVLPAALVTALPESPEGQADATAADMERPRRLADAALIGPGLGTGQGAGKTLDAFLSWPTGRGCILDADALNLVAVAGPGSGRLPRGCVVTPHAGEMARLSGRSREEVQARRRDVAIGFAREHGVVVVLKGAGTVVTDGERLFTNSTGSHALARGGTGDLLAGILVALLARRMDPFDAAVLAVHAHGLAADLARKSLGAMGMTPGDILDALPAAWRALGDT